MREHAFGVGVGGDDEVVRLFVRLFVGLAVVGLEVVVEGSLSGFVELFRVGVWRIWGLLEHSRFSVIGAATLFATKRGVAAGRRLVDRWKSEARRARGRPAHSHHQVRG
ncbi:hypothetical protein D3C84_1034920 [compost metagenome]